jgi:hypothetical protein
MHIATTHVALEKNLTKSIFPQGTADTRRRSSEFSLDAKPMGPSNYQIGLFLRQVAVKPSTGKTGFSSLRWDLPEHRRTRWRLHVHVVVDHRPNAGSCICFRVRNMCVLNDVLLQPFLRDLRSKLPSLFGRFTGSRAQSNFSRTCMSVVRLWVFTDRPSQTTEGAL